MSTNADKKTPKAQKSPAGTKPKSLDAIVHELALVNKKRREKGLSPLSYGKYVAQLDGRL